MRSVPAPPARASGEDVAYHEAGHVVVGSMLGLKVLATDVRGDGQGGNGHTTFAPEPPTPEFNRRVVTTFLAGRAAELAHNSGADPDGFGFDLDAVGREWAARLSPREAERWRLLEAYESDAERILRRPDAWAAVRAVAAALLSRRSLTGREATAIARVCVREPHELRLRQAALDDAPLAAGIWSAAVPEDPEDPESLRHDWESREPGDPSRDYLLETDAGSAGAALYDRRSWEEDAERRCLVLPVLLPEHERLAERAYQVLEEIAAGEGALALLTAAREDRPERVALVAGRGYREVMRFPRWVLDLTAEGSRIRSLAERARERARAAGVELKKYSDFTVPDRLERLHDAMEESREDSPRSNAFVRQSVERRRAWLAGPKIREDRIWLAVRDGRVLGVSLLGFPPTRGLVWTEWTGTVRSARGQGLARALKLETLVQALDLGVAEVMTSNQSGNAPVMHLNREFRYQPAPGWIHYRREVSPPAGGA